MSEQSGVDTKVVGGVVPPGPPPAGTTMHDPSQSHPLRTPMRSQFKVTRPPGVDEDGKIRFKFKVYRDCDSWHLRKVVVQIHNDTYMNPLPIERTRMFAWPFFEKRLQRRMRKMANHALAMTVAGQFIATIDLSQQKPEVAE